ncbi:hypothetical protein [uncultured Acetatifactor sp.]|uniref:hypothetical protein n=2 Tax=uncultured Acetatifactor sp. TaxID=1671927 RepID=UPI0026136B45|nr:hypothetical protein [uncultured Acetatifactor sp.]
MMKKMRFVPWKRRLYRLPVRYFFGNRNVKDRLFCYIFEHDRKSLLKLYNALNGTDYRDEQALQIVTLDNVVYMAMNNDVAFLLGASLNLYEHQSTLCPNLPLRFLIYLAAEFESLVGKNGGNIYGSSLIRLPAPRCVVFYNGEDAAEEEQILQLTDAFTDENGKKQKSCLNLTVRVLNINYGYNEELMSGCRRLEEYSLFVAKLKEFQRRDFSLDEAIDSAVAYCIEHRILDDILLPFQTEVKKMLLTEYDEKKTMKAFRKEAFQEGYQKGETKGYQQGEAERQKLAQELQEAQRHIAELQEAQNQGASLTEGKKMLLTEYDEKKTMKAFRKEAFQEGYQKGEAERQKLAQELQEAQRQIAELQEMREQFAALQKMQAQLTALQQQNEELRLFTDTLRNKDISLEALPQSTQQYPTKKEG